MSLLQDFAVTVELPLVEPATPFKLGHEYYTDDDLTRTYRPAVAGTYRSGRVHEVLQTRGGPTVLFPAPFLANSRDKDAKRKHVAKRGRR